MFRHSLNESYCIKEKDYFKFRGIFGSPIFEQIDIRLKLCDNATSNGTCAPFEEIRNYFKGVIYIFV